MTVGEACQLLWLVAGWLTGWRLVYLGFACHDWWRAGRARR